MPDGPCALTVTTLLIVAAARSDVPALIAEVRRLRAQRREALALANSEVAQWERDNRMPAVWAGEIREALEADDE